MSAAGLDIALRRLGVFPDAAGWRRFADRLLLAAGSVLLLAGVVFFFAFNWSDLHRFAKIALVALPLTLAASMAARAGLDRVEGQAWLGAAVVLSGVLLAVIGQIYQTGADSELLFAGWALLVWPWVMVACAPWLWLFWLLLVNTALALFMLGRLDVWAVLLFFDATFGAPLLFNALALLLWESLWPRLAWLRVAYVPLIYLGVLGAAGWGVWSNERILAEGRIVLLELAPLDPRSLLQGDFMALDYALNAALRQQQARADAYAVLRLDGPKVATLVRVQTALMADSAPPVADEIVIRYRVRQHRLQIASNAFFFQEGREPEFRNARYGEFRVGRDGEPRLTALLDADLNRLGENRY